MIFLREFFLNHFKLSALTAFTAVALSIFPPSASARSLSAKGTGYLVPIPLGRDSVFVSEIRGVNEDSIHTTCFKFDFHPAEKSAFFPPIPSAKWISAVQESICAPPLTDALPLHIRTDFPLDSSLFNRRFGASVSVSRFHKGSLAMSLNLGLFMETESKRFVSEKRRELQIAPISAPFVEEWDSILIYNNRREIDTIQIYWTASLNSRTENPANIVVSRRFMIWNIPIDKIILGPGKKEWLYFKKPFDYTGSNGYIVFIGRSQTLFCDLQTSSGVE